MTYVDLVTGFLGSGKTTFIRKYAEYLMRQGLNIGIIENDFGAVNVDMMFLSDLEDDKCTVEMVAGGCDRDCHARRFKTKLIALGMQGLDRVIIEPSGIYDTEEFFDVLNEEPLDRWYKIGSVITIADINTDVFWSKTSKYMMATQLSCCGCVVASKVMKDTISGENCTKINTIQNFRSALNQILSDCNCERKLDEELIFKPWDELTNEDFELISGCGHKIFTVSKDSFCPEDEYQSLYYMNNSITLEQLQSAVKKLFLDETAGKIIRIKGFIKNETGEWIEVNATKDETSISKVSQGQDVIIVIGEGLREEVINAYF